MVSPAGSGKNQWLAQPAMAMECPDSLRAEGGISQKIGSGLEGRASFFAVASAGGLADSRAGSLEVVRHGLLLESLAESSKGRNTRASMGERGSRLMGAAAVAGATGAEMVAGFLAGAGAGTGGVTLTMGAGDAGGGSTCVGGGSTCVGGGRLGVGVIWLDGLRVVAGPEDCPSP